MKGTIRMFRFLTKQIALAILSTALLGNAGCTMFIKGDTIQEYKSGRDPVMIEATKDGEYALYNVFETTPRGTFKLKAGDQIGFKASRTGRVIAVAGNKEMEVADGSYIWKRNPPVMIEKVETSSGSTGATPNKN